MANVGLTQSEMTVLKNAIDENGQNIRASQTRLDGEYQALRPRAKGTWAQALDNLYTSATNETNLLLQDNAAMGEQVGVTSSTHGANSDAQQAVFARLGPLLNGGTQSA